MTMRWLSMSLTFSVSIQRVVLRWRRAHHQSAMIRESSCVYESRDFFLAEDRRKAKRFFSDRGLGDAPGFLESFDVEESQSCQSLVTVPGDNLRCLNSSA